MICVYRVDRLGKLIIDTNVELPVMGFRCSAGSKFTAQQSLDFHHKMRNIRGVEIGGAVSKYLIDVHKGRLFPVSAVLSEIIEVILEYCDDGEELIVLDGDGEPCDERGQRIAAHPDPSNAGLSRKGWFRRLFA